MKMLFQMMMAAVALGGLQGCASAGSRVRSYADVAGVYAATEQDGKPLPHAMPFTIGGKECTRTLVRLVMTLLEDGTWTEEGEARTSCPGEPPRVEPLDTRQPFGYTLRGAACDTLVLAPPGFDGDPPSPVQIVGGVIVGDEIRLTLPYQGDTVRYRYVRRPPPD